MLQGAKLYKNVKKQYVFEPPDGENEKLMKIMYEYDVYDKIKSNINNQSQNQQQSSNKMLSARN